ncbi:hypothetical protein McanMca71_004043 [Microsporum canis]|uniref:Aminoglycoside phosphotransferase domain-containing protein n=1 Tax=Arthroderma otae (strain ATCC MYA-4605 / CBS 113480) TaxID=554155 RepID=C5FRU3_ARTOC|nr:conserved hypothetical protein [Microsporum canis CBS 113480]EEQ32596.1 conserved hypothetical protein [Microsporum canis CBS 113480]
MEKDEKISRPDSAQSDNAAIFSLVISALNLESLPAFCARARKASTDSVENQEALIEPINIEPPLFGSYHALFPIRFQDGLRWILKIPACGTSEHFNASASSALQSEALTMKLIRRETSVPVPDVFEFDATVGNELGVPFILMSFIQGTSLTLEDIARTMAELSSFLFPTGGALMFDMDGKPTPGPSRFVDHQAMLERLGQGDDDDIEPALYFEAGPFTDPQDFYLLSLDRTKEPEKNLHRGLRRLLQILLRWIPVPPDPKLVLTHPDLNLQNVLVSEDGSLQGLIDWDGVAAVPRFLGNEKYPSWLTRDWDPAMYAWNEEMEQGIEQDTLWEDSPGTLALHRKEYNDAMQRYLSLQGDLVESYTPASQGSSTTQKSLFVENLLIAAEDPICRFGILTKFVEKIVELAQANSLDHTSNQYGNLEIFDIANDLAEGKLEREMLDFLRRGFETLLNQRFI